MPNRRSHPSTCRLLRALKIPHTVPERTDQINRRQTQGAIDGRPAAFDANLHRERNTGKRGVARLRQCHGIATRYDKHAIIYLATIVLNQCILI